MVNLGASSASIVFCVVYIMFSYLTFYIPVNMYARLGLWRSLLGGSSDLSKHLFDDHTSTYS